MHKNFAFRHNLPASPNLKKKFLKKKHWHLIEGNANLSQIFPSLLLSLIERINRSKIFLLELKLLHSIKAGVHLNGIFAPLNTGLLQISRWHFKQSKNSMLKTWIYVIGCFVIFLVIFGYIWVEIAFLQGLEKFREIRKIEDLMKFKN